MIYNVKRNEEKFVLEANNDKKFFELFSKLPEGEYTVNVVGEARRAAKHRRRFFNIKNVQFITVILEVLCVLVCFCSFIAMWVILAAFA